MLKLEFRSFPTILIVGFMVRNEGLKVFESFEIPKLFPMILTLEVDILGILNLLLWIFQKRNLFSLLLVVHI